MNSVRQAILPTAAVLLLLLAATCVQCQLTFSPDWGKRSGPLSASFFDNQPGNCKTPNEMLLDIFKFVQNQAQLFLDCKHRE
ncbi:adipokinetic hormone [Musca vetustissima]|uniref:adipokinetic hormone n=1 Tax=Musca vetustissima TaxID=27455 RepID=UPI002AB7C805|nr:adipokinetic hormone [Musca vetustissima]